MERLDTHLRLSSKLERRRRCVASTLGVSLGALFTAQQITGVVINESAGGIAANAVLLGLASGVLGFGVFHLIRKTTLERLYDSFQNSDLSTSSARAAALVRTEKAWGKEVYRHLKRRRVRAFSGVILGGIIIAASIAYGSVVHIINGEFNYRFSAYSAATAYGILGATMLSSGIWHFRHPSPLEEAWRAYNDRRKVQGPSSPKAHITAAPFVGENNAGLAIGGVF